MITSKLLILDSRCQDSRGYIKGHCRDSLQRPGGIGPQEEGVPAVTLESHPSRGLS